MDAKTKGTAKLNAGPAPGFGALDAALSSYRACPLYRQYPRSNVMDRYAFDIAVLEGMLLSFEHHVISHPPGQALEGHWMDRGYNDHGVVHEYGERPAHDEAGRFFSVPRLDSFDGRAAWRRERKDNRRDEALLDNRSVFRDTGS